MAEAKGLAACYQEAPMDLVGRIRFVLQNSEEPLTLAKVRAALPSPFRSLAVEALADALQRHVAANVLVRYPRYRSPRERYWDRPMRVHLEQLLRGALRQGGRLMPVKYQAAVLHAAERPLSVETVIAAIENDPGHLIAESADLLFHLLVLLKSRGIKLEDVEAALAQRTGMSGLEEKASRKRER